MRQSKRAVRKCRLCEERSDEAISNYLTINKIASLRSQRRSNLRHSRTACKDNRRLVAGCMTGTSIDGIDAALVEISGNGLEIDARFVKGVSGSLGTSGSELRAFADGKSLPAGAITRLAWELGRIHVEILKELLADASPSLLVLHGQTVFHKPPLSWQLIDPWQVAANFPCEVIFDLRGADLSVGGEGAPITPLADYILFRNEDGARVVVNLGGFINFTYLPAGKDIDSKNSANPEAWVAAIRGGDVSPCNQLLDRIARQLLGKAFDEGGTAALSGQVNEIAFDNLVKRLSPFNTVNKSLGSGDEAFGWIDEFAGELTPEDMLRTACAGIAARLARELSTFGQFDLLSAGGGVRNKALVSEIESRVGAVVQPTDRWGIPSEYREAVEIAVLGDLARNGIDITLPQISGRKANALHGCLIRGFGK